MHARQLALQQGRVRIEQPLHAAGPFRAGEGADTNALTQKCIVPNFPRHQQQVAAVLGQGQGILGAVAE